MSKFSLLIFIIVLALCGCNIEKEDDENVDGIAIEKLSDYLETLDSAGGPYDILIKNKNPNLEKLKSALTRNKKIKINLDLSQCSRLYAFEYLSFAGVTNVCSIIFPKNLKSIGAHAFAGCRCLKEIKLPDGVTEIGTYAFAFCTALTSVSIPASVETIGSSAFLEDTGLTDIVIPYGVKSIESFAFDKNTNLKSIVIPNSVLSIGFEAFARCNSLTAVIIPASVNDIEEAVFLDCSELTSIIVDKNNKVYDSRDNCNGVIETATDTLIAGCKKTVIPNSIKCIGQMAFDNCTELKSITIPDSVTYIDYAAFRDSGLITVTFESAIPPTIHVDKNNRGIFEYCSELTTIYVPSESVDVYKSADNWNKYADFIMAITD